MLSNGRASPVRMVKLARAVLVMVTFLSWIATVRTSFYTVRILVWNRSGLTFRSVGSSGILLPVLCVQEWYAVYQRVRRVHLLLSREVLGVVHFGHSGCSLESCACGRCWLCCFFPSCLQYSGYAGMLFAGHALRAEVGEGILFVTLGELSGLHINVLSFFRVLVVIPWIWCYIC